MKKNNTSKWLVFFFVIINLLPVIVFGNEHVEVVGYLNIGKCDSICIDSYNYDIYYLLAGGGGEISVIDITDPAIPKKTMSTEISSPDVNGIFLSNALSHGASAHRGGCAISGDNLYSIGANFGVYPYGTTSLPTFIYSSFIGNLPGYMNKITAVASNEEYAVSFLYVADIENGLQIIKMETWNLIPNIVGTYTIPEGAYDVCTSGTLAYVATLDGLEMIDVTDPTKPTLSGSYDATGAISSFDISGNLMYVTDDNGLDILDLSNPTQPVLIGNYPADYIAEKVVVSDGMAYVSDASKKLLFLDVSDPTKPTLRGFYESFNHIMDMLAYKGSVYVAEGEHGLVILKYAPIIKHIEINGPKEVDENSSAYYTFTVSYDDGTTKSMTNDILWNEDSPYVGIKDGSLLTSRMPEEKTDQQCKITASYYGQTVEFPITIKKINQKIQFVSQIGSAGECNAVCVDNGYLYSGDRFGMSIFDASSPTNPKMISRILLPDTIKDIFVSEGYAYVADSFFGLQIIDVKDTFNPKIIGSYDTMGDTQKVIVSDNIAYLADGERGLQIIDVSNLTQPKLLSTYGVLGSVSDIYVSGNIIYVADGINFQILNIENPKRPIICSTLASTIHSFAIYQGFVYMILASPSSHGTSNPALCSFDISDPYNPVYNNYYSYSAYGNFKLLASAGKLYTYTSYGEMHTYDITNPSHPVQEGFYYAFHWPDTGSFNTIAVSGNTIYIACPQKGIFILDTSDPTQPLLANSMYDNIGSRPCISGSLAYLMGAGGLEIVDISNPSQPKFVGSYSIPNSSGEVYVVGNLAYVTDFFTTLHIIDVSDPKNPSLVGSCDFENPNYATFIDMYVSSDFAYLVGNNELVTVNINDPANPEVSSRYYYTSENITGAYFSINLAYLATQSSGLLILDLSDPYNPTQLGSYNQTNIMDVAVSKNIAYVVGGEEGLQLLDVSNPSKPTLINSYGAPTIFSRVSVSDCFAYISNSLGTEIIDIRNPYSLYCFDSFNNYFGWDISAQGKFMYASNGSGLWIFRYPPEVASYEFTKDTDNWTTGGAENVFTLPYFDYTTDSLIIQSKDANTFGYWRSPLDAVEYTTNSLYRATFTIRGSASQEEAPAFRYHMDTQSATTFGVGIVESWMGGTESPDWTQKEYSLYFNPMNQDGYQSGEYGELTDDLFVGFDMINFNPADNPYGAYYIDNVTVERFDTNLLTTGTLVKTYDTTEDFSNWVFSSYTNYFRETSHERGDGYLRLTAMGDNTNTYSCWESSRTADEVNITTNTLYRARFTVSSHSEQSKCPMMRLRIGTESNKMCSAYIVNSNLDGINSPNINGKQYDVYMYPPQSDVNNPSYANGLIFAMDMLNFGGYDDMYGDLVLDKVEVQAFDKDLVP